LRFSIIALDLPNVIVVIRFCQVRRLRNLYPHNRLIMATALNAVTTGAAGDVHESHTFQRGDSNAMKSAAL
jgi:hypothetical protein